MMSLLYEFIVYVVEAVISGVFLVHFLPTKYNKVFQIALWCEVVMVVLFVTPSYSLVRIGIITVCEFVFTLCLCEGAWLNKIKTFLFKEFILLTSSCLAYGTYALLIEDAVPFWSGCHPGNCTYCLMYLLIFSVFTSIVFQFTKNKKNVEFPWVVGTQLIIGLGEWFSVVAVANAANGVIDATRSVFIVIAMVMMVAANISIGTLAPYFLKKIAMSNNMDYGKELSNMEFKYYEMSVENDKKLLTIKHDISNHIQTIYSLFANGEHAKGMELIDELKSRYALVEQMVYCNNPVVNIILSNKKQEAEKLNIETHIKVKDSLDGVPITNFDLSTVICNLLDNAIRGCVCSQQSHPRMIIEILEKNRYLVIRVLNSCKMSMNIESTERIETTKSNSQTHGFGMPIIAGIAKKHRGDFIVSAQNGVFTATVVMSVK